MSQVSYIVARERRRRANGGDRTCAVEGCGESRTFAIHEQRQLPGFARRKARSYCYNHLLFRGGEAPERHHISGLECGPAWPVPGNDHRVLTAKMEHLLPRRFRLPGRSPTEEHVATIVGHVLLADELLERSPSPYRQIEVPPGTSTLTVNVTDSPRFVHVYGTDEAWWQPNGRTPLVSLR